jgi:porin
MKSMLPVALCALIWTTNVWSSDAPTIIPGLSTDEVENQIALDRASDPLYTSRLLAPMREWRDNLGGQTGLNMSLDYSALYMHVSESLGEDDASGGMVRFFGYWDLVDRGGPNKGSLNWKLEHRHSYSSIPPSALGFESGYAGLFGPPFSDQGSRLTTLYWKQFFGDGNGAAVAGFLDVTDYVDVYLLASPWMGFVNFAFSTGAATIDLPNDATLGTAVGGMVHKNILLQAGISDANSDPTDPFNGFKSVADESDFFKWVELALTPSKDAAYFDNIHLTLWHIDERANGTPAGWGLNASYQQWIADKWLPFVRGGYTEDSGSLMEQAIAAGIGYQPVPMRGVIGAALHWGKPNEVSFGEVDEQLTTELFWRYQLTKELALTPTLQYIDNPALNPDESSLWAFGLRARIAL